MLRSRSTANLLSFSIFLWRTVSSAPEYLRVGMVWCEFRNECRIIINGKQNDTDHDTDQASDRCHNESSVILFRCIRISSFPTVKRKYNYIVQRVLFSPSSDLLYTWCRFEHPKISRNLSKLFKNGKVLVLIQIWVHKKISGAEIFVSFSIGFMLLTCKTNKWFQVPTNKIACRLPSTKPNQNTVEIV